MIAGQGTELMMLIKPLRTFINGIHHDAYGADFTGVFPTALQGIYQMNTTT